MSHLLEHFQLMLGSSDPSSSQDSAVNDWQTPSGQQSSDTDIDVEDREWGESVLDEYKQHVNPSTGTSRDAGARIVNILSGKPAYDVLLPSLQRILSSAASDDEISMDLVELLGYDELELVQELISNRTSVLNQLQSGGEQPQPQASHATSTQPEDFAHLIGTAKRRRQQQLEENAARPMFTGTAAPEAEKLPHVYTSATGGQGNVVSTQGSKFLLPIGTERTMHEEYEEVVVPPARPTLPAETERFIPIVELPALVRNSFPSGYKTLNRIQSIVFPTAFQSNENMLVCAPTGAGKTDVAMLTILRILDQYRTPNSPSEQPVIRKEAFKIIYVAPMKALASEIVRKLSKRLKWLSIEVRELTGDMQLTKAEIARTQIIVTTPEKWDVVTRKPTGEGELASILKLLIIDEVHLLNDERGAVIETIVARTLRQVESSQTMIRIVGLSATLPNYKDVAEFLCVSRYHGLFFFDSSFRPVPLEQHFLGIKGKPGSLQSRKNMDRVTFEKVSQLVSQGHQVMVFVHARKETVKAALALQESATIEGSLEEFSCEDNPQWSLFRRQIGESRNKEMRQLFDSGFGIHHAGMLRSDRNMMERMFEAKAIKVLCCTATLAWGVNLPAHAVVIKGTQVYDSSKGQFVDLSVLDVLQIFGRAGRPGMEDSGEGYICTSEDKLTHYLDAVTSTIPIESQFQSGIVDALNAEISLGTVSTVDDAVVWMGYTYLFVRMRVNPFFYGISRETVNDDPQLGSKRRELVQAAAKRLCECNMIMFDSVKETYTSTDLGRIAARYYIRSNSIELFNKTFRPRMSEADVFAMLSQSTEFEQIQVRDTELAELESLLQLAPCDVESEKKSKNESGPKGDGKTKDGITSTASKVNILLQAYISRALIQDFALVSDSAYVAQNAGRIMRALLEISISKRWAKTTTVIIGLSKAIESRLWPYAHPLRQFALKADTLHMIEQWADEMTLAELASMTAEEIGKLIHMNAIHGQAVLTAAKQFPALRITYTLRPVASNVLNVLLVIQPDFDWNAKLHGSSLAFWIWIEDTDILQSSYSVFHDPKKEIHLSFYVPTPDGQSPELLSVRYISDRWVGAEDAIELQTLGILMPKPPPLHTPLLHLPLLQLPSLGDSTLADLFAGKITVLNNIQTQSFWMLTQTNQHALLCAPSGSGKTVSSQLVIWSTVMRATSPWILAVLPTRIAAMDLHANLRPIAKRIGVTLEVGIQGKRLRQPKISTIQVVSADQLLDALASLQRIDEIRGLDLVLCEDLDQLDFDYELAVSLLRYFTQRQPTRFVGVSASLDNSSDLASWLNVDPMGVCDFRPQDRDQSLRVQHQTFAIPYSTSLFKAMTKPACQAIEEAPPNSPVLVFVPSKEQCKGIALDLITYRTVQKEAARGYVPPDVSDDLLHDYCARLQDRSLIDFVVKGVGFFHSRINRADRLLILEMYAEGIISVLLAPRETCWSIPVRAVVVIVMGTQSLYVEKEWADRQLKDYTIRELSRMQSRAVQQIGTGYFHLFCPGESLDTYTRFLENGLPLESELLEPDNLERWQSIYKHRSTRKQLGDFLSFTYLSRRITSNPTYYEFKSRDRTANSSSVVDQIMDICQKASNPQASSGETGSET